MTAAAPEGLTDFAVELNDGIVHAKLVRPAARNAIRSATLDDLESLLGWLEGAEARALVLSGDGGVFSAGADLKEMDAASPDRLRSFVARGADLFRALSELGIPTAAVIEGVAVGGGLELALACDERHAVAGSRVGLPEVTLGHLPGWGAVERVPGLAGTDAAIEVLATGRIVDAERAVGLGLVTAVHPDRATALDVAAQRAAARPRGPHIAVIKRAMARRVFGNGDASRIVLDGVIDGMLRSRTLSREGVR
ncbi:enoyl-CoA hydratase/isomerase family protein [Microbacterium sp. CPCC 204701]|uniref:enoyl-CoA hydratase/isomerase family protein n=1 Tax=Microbacterium sp. CPCC 204701 TaxID=2493084 RepID=UPI000FD7E262|nr:enoyl-CoA hydratase/isomerase family protein [Microbacterium sp. CPCC 204701]